MELSVGLEVGTVKALADTPNPLDYAPRQMGISCRP
jgi:hypothetical protein